jgi:hypothetical protein
MADKYSVMTVPTAAAPCSWVAAPGADLVLNPFT